MRKAYDRRKSDRLHFTTEQLLYAMCDITVYQTLLHYQIL